MGLTSRERFINTMEYREVDRVPNYEVGVWAQTVERWVTEGLGRYDLDFNWCVGEEYFHIDPRDYIPVNYRMLPAYDYRVLEKTERYEIVQQENGIVTKALVEGTVNGGRACMDQYIRFPVSNMDDWKMLKKRYVPSHKARYPSMWREINLPCWKRRQVPLCLGNPTGMLGFYWRAREWMGFENLSYALFDQPDLIDDMMEFIEVFTIETSRPVLEKTDVDFIWISEDMAMKTGPLISPEMYKRYIFPHMCRLVEYMKSNGVRYVVVDSDGNCEALIPLLMEAGVDAIWPLERAAGMDPLELRKKYGKSLRLWGGVDKRILAKGTDEIDRHLAMLEPLVSEGGFIPSVDHLVPPDVPYDNFKHYIRRKLEILKTYD